MKDMSTPQSSVWQPFPTSLPFCRTLFAFKPSSLGILCYFDKMQYDEYGSLKYYLPNIQLFIIFICLSSNAENKRKEQ